MVEILGTNRYNARLSDFGSAKLLSALTEIPGGSTSVTSAHWVAPEHIIRSDDGYSVSFSNATTYGDIWAFGCTMIEVNIYLHVLYASD